jgi:hypothetical protein
MQRGNLGNDGLMRVLGFFERKLDRILSGLFSKPIRRRKRVRAFSKPIRRSNRVSILDKAAGWASVADPEAGLGLLSDSGLELSPNLNQVRF